MTKISNIDVVRSVKRRSKSQSKINSKSQSKIRFSMSERNLDEVFNFKKGTDEVAELRVRCSSVTNTPIRKRHEFLKPSSSSFKKRSSKTSSFMGLKSIQKSIRKLLSPGKKIKAVPVLKTLERKISDYSVVFWEEIYPDSPIPTRKMQVNKIC